MSTQHPPQKLIIVGNGMVGHHVVEQLVDSGALATFEVTIFGEERHRAYDRVHLSEYFSGRDAQSLALCDADYYATNGITLRSGEAVTAIDREQQTVRTAQGAYLANADNTERSALVWLKNYVRTTVLAASVMGAKSFTGS